MDNDTELAELIRTQYTTDLKAINSENRICSSRTFDATLRHRIARPTVEKAKAVIAEKLRRLAKDGVTAEVLEDYQQYADIGFAMHDRRPKVLKDCGQHTREMQVYMTSLEQAFRLIEETREARHAAGKCRCNRFVTHAETKPFP